MIIDEFPLFMVWSFPWIGKPVAHSDGLFYPGFTMILSKGNT